MRTNFDSFMDELEREAKKEGPEAVKQLHAFGEHFASVAIQIAARRKQMKWSQGELGARSGIQQAEISRIEKGKGNPTLKTLAALSTALGEPLRVGDRGARRGRAAVAKKRLTAPAAKRIHSPSRKTR